MADALYFIGVHLCVNPKKVHEVTNPVSLLGLLRLIAPKLSELNCKHQSQVLSIFTCTRIINSPINTNHWRIIKRFDIIFHVRMCYIQNGVLYMKYKIGTIIAEAKRSRTKPFTKRVPLLLFKDKKPSKEIYLFWLISLSFCQFISLSLTLSLFLSLSLSVWLSFILSVSLCLFLNPSPHPV